MAVLNYVEVPYVSAFFKAFLCGNYRVAKPMTAQEIIALFPFETRAKTDGCMKDLYLDGPMSRAQGTNFSDDAAEKMYRLLANHNLLPPETLREHPYTKHIGPRL